MCVCVWGGGVTGQSRQMTAHESPRAAGMNRVAGNGGGLGGCRGRGLASLGNSHTPCFHPALPSQDISAGGGQLDGKGSVGKLQEENRTLKADVKKLKEQLADSKQSESCGRGRSAQGGEKGTQAAD